MSMLGDSIRPGRSAAKIEDGCYEGGERVSDLPDPALTLDEADFILDPVALADTYDDGEEVTQADVFFADASHAPILAHDGSRWVVRVDGSQWMDGPDDLLDGESQLSLVAVVRVKNDQAAGEYDSRLMLAATEPGDHASDTRTRYHLTLRGDDDGDMYADLRVRQRTKDAIREEDEWATARGGRPLQAVDQILVSTADVGSGRIRTFLEDQQVGLDTTPETGNWPDGGQRVSLFATGPDDDRAFSGDIIMLAGFFRDLSSEEHGAILDEVRSDYYERPSITVATDDRYEGLESTNPDEFFQFTYPYYGDRACLYRDIDAMTVVTDPGRHRIRAVRNPFTGEIITLEHGEGPVWLGPEHGALFRGDAHITGTDEVWRAEDYESDRTVFLRYTQHDDGPPEHFPLHARHGDDHGWVDRADQRSEDEFRWRTHHVDEGGTAGVTLPLDEPITVGHTWESGEGHTVYRGDDVVETVDPIALNSSTGPAGVGADFDFEDRKLWGIVEATVWYQRVVSQSDIEMIAEHL